MFTRTTIASIHKLAAQYGIEPAAVLAVAEVESAGVAYWNVGAAKLPAIRIEGHYFYRNLTGAQRTQAVRQGLANPNAGRVSNPRSYAGRYAKFEQMKAINAEAAYRSISIGLGQVMGEHFSKLGFRSARDMFAYACVGVAEQVDIMLRYVDRWNLKDELQNLQWAKFARAYNGSGYRKNRYDTKMANAYARWSGGRGTAVNNNILEWQTDLKKLGYNVGPLDGKIGRRSRAALRKFQSDKGLVPDGKFGPMTDKAIDDALAARTDRQAAFTGKCGGASAVTGTAAETARSVVVADMNGQPERPGVENAQEAVQQSTDYLSSISAFLDSPIITVLMLVLIFGGLGLTLWSIFRKPSS